MKKCYIVNEKGLFANEHTLHLSDSLFLWSKQHLEEMVKSCGESPVACHVNTQDSITEAGAGNQYNCVIRSRKPLESKLEDHKKEVSLEGIVKEMLESLNGLMELAHPSYPYIGLKPNEAAHYPDAKKVNHIFYRLPIGWSSSFTTWGQPAELVRKHWEATLRLTRAAEALQSIVDSEELVKEGRATNFKMAVEPLLQAVLRGNSSAHTNQTSTQRSSHWHLVDLDPLKYHQTQRAFAIFACGTKKGFVSSHKSIGAIESVRLFESKEAAERSAKSAKYGQSMGPALIISLSVGALKIEASVGAAPQVSIMEHLAQAEASSLMGLINAHASTPKGPADADGVQKQRFPAPNETTTVPSRRNRVEDQHTKPPLDTKAPEADSYQENSAQATCVNCFKRQGESGPSVLHWMESAPCALVDQTSKGCGPKRVSPLPLNLCSVHRDQSQKDEDLVDSKQATKNALAQKGWGHLVEALSGEHKSYAVWYSGKVRSMGAEEQMGYFDSKGNLVRLSGAHLTADREQAQHVLEKNPWAGSSRALIEVSLRPHEVLMVLGVCAELPDVRGILRTAKRDEPELSLASLMSVSPNAAAGAVSPLVGKTGHLTGASNASSSDEPALISDPRVQIRRL